MKYVQLSPKTASSAIGFGCASMMGAVSRERSLRALAVAIEQGINHFDTAPSYGYGESEKLLGEFLAGRRDRVVIATKYGVEVSSAALLLRPLKSTARAVLGLIRKKRQGGGGPRTNVPMVGKGFHRHVPITSQGLEQSVERSLKRLRTDYIDMLFLHEPSAAIEKPDEVFAAVQRLKQSGKVLTFGLSSLVAELPVHKAYVHAFDLLQLNCPADPARYDEIRQSRGEEKNVLFSPFSAGGDAGTDRSNKLASVLRDFPNSVVLCSMFSEDHIVQNASIG